MQALHWAMRIMTCTLVLSFVSGNVIVDQDGTFKDYSNFSTDESFEATRISSTVSPLPQVLQNYQLEHPGSVRTQAVVGGSVILACGFPYPPNMESNASESAAATGSVDVVMIKWQKQGIEVPIIIQLNQLTAHIDADYRGRLRLLDNANGSLEITGVEARDEGWYKCNVGVFSARTDDSNPNGTWVYLAVTGSHEANKSDVQFVNRDALSFSSLNSTVTIEFRLPVNDSQVVDSFNDDKYLLLEEWILRVLNARSKTTTTSDTPITTETTQEIQVTTELMAITETGTTPELLTTAIPTTSEEITTSPEVTTAEWVTAVDTTTDMPTTSETLTSESTTTSPEVTEPEVTVADITTTELLTTAETATTESTTPEISTPEIVPLVDTTVALPMTTEMTKTESTTTSIEITTTELEVTTITTTELSTTPETTTTASTTTSPAISTSELVTHDDTTTALSTTTETTTTTPVITTTETVMAHSTTTPWEPVMRRRRREAVDTENDYLWTADDVHFVLIEPKVVGDVTRVSTFLNKSDSGVVDPDLLWNVIQQLYRDNLLKTELGYDVNGEERGIYRGLPLDDPFTPPLPLVMAQWEFFLPLILLVICFIVLFFVIFCIVQYRKQRPPAREKPLEIEPRYQKLEALPPLSNGHKPSPDVDSNSDEIGWIIPYDQAVSLLSHSNLSESGRPEEMTFL